MVICDLMNLARVSPNIKSKHLKAGVNRNSEATRAKEGWRLRFRRLMRNSHGIGLTTSGSSDDLITPLRPSAHAKNGNAEQPHYARLGNWLTRKLYSI